MRPQFETREYESEQEFFAGANKVVAKTNQLCRQIEEAISCALASAANSKLRDLLVLEVLPVRGAAAVQVLVCMEKGNEPESHEIEQVETALGGAMGYFRREVARAIHRKRVPSLEIVVVPELQSEEVFYDED